MASATNTIYMTQSEYDDLVAEVGDLEIRGRREMAEAIAHARSFGDVAENAEYHATRDEQVLLEARIEKLRDRLQNAEVVEAAGRVANIGSLVEVDADGERMRFLLSHVVGVEGDIHSVSPVSPVGMALMGVKAGDEIKVKAPRGSWTGTVKSVRAAK